MVIRVRCMHCGADLGIAGEADSSWQESWGEPVSHGVCEECVATHYGDLMSDSQERKHRQFAVLMNEDETKRVKSAAGLSGKPLGEYLHDAIMEYVDGGGSDARDKEKAASAR